MPGDATQDRFLGAILGLAIGDAFGMPVAGWTATTIADFYGVVTDYLPRKFPDGNEVHPGEITDETEIALCIIESVTAAQGEIDVENIGIRMAYLARSDSRKWMSPTTLAALDGISEEVGFQLPLVDDEDVSPDIVARGIPVGLMHAMGTSDSEGLARDAEAVIRITHGSPFAQSVVATVAQAIALAARQSVPLNELQEAVLPTLPDGAVRMAMSSLSRDKADTDASAVANVVADALAIVKDANTFQEVIERSVAPGGAADSRAALAASLFAGHHGSASIPQKLIDGLEARIYVSLAVPWFYRTVARRTGRSIDMRFTQDRF